MPQRNTVVQVGPVSTAKGCHVRTRFLLQVSEDVSWNSVHIIFPLLGKGTGKNRGAEIVSKEFSFPGQPDKNTLSPLCCNT